MASYGSIGSTVPPVLQQKCYEVENGASKLVLSSTAVQSGNILTYRGQDTKYFWTFNKAGNFFLYRYLNGTRASNLLFVHPFGSSTTVKSVVFYPASAECPGIAVGVSDFEAKESNYVAYFSLRTFRIVNCFIIPQSITSLYNIYDGTTPLSTFTRLSKQFHDGWHDILLVGCVRGYVYLIRLDVISLETDECAVTGLVRRTRRHVHLISRKDAINTSSSEESDVEWIKPTRPKRMIPLTKIFQGDEMFTFKSNEGRQICMEKDNVYVSSLYYIEKCNTVLIGFNFGGIVFISLASSKISAHYFGEGVVKFFTVQEPDDDPRPILYYWTCLQSPTKGTLMILSTINFPKDEGKDSSEYTYYDPVPYPLLKWAPENCDEMIAVRTLYLNRQRSVQTMDDTEDSVAVDRSTPLEANSSSFDTSLMLMVWQQHVNGIDDKPNTMIRGSLFDMNAFYAKRLSARVVPDNTLARQYPFLSLFSSEKPIDVPFLLDAFPTSVYRYPAPTFLKKSIDQLFYPSTFYIDFNVLANTKIFQCKIQPIQIQLVSALIKDISTCFAQPADSSKWICAIGLANSTPADCINEQRACLLRVLIHIFIPGILKLIKTSEKDKEALKFIQRWIWKEVELTKAKFDDLCAPLFAGSCVELSPDARGYVHHSRAFFRRACNVYEAMSVHVNAFDDQDWNESITLQFKAVRQVELFSLGIAFGLTFDLLPLKHNGLKVHNICVDSIHQKFATANIYGCELEIHKLVSEFMRLNPNDAVWNGMKAESWFPPSEFTHFLPTLLFMNISEALKISLLGYYCLEYEAAMHQSEDLINEIQLNLFDKCCAFFMQDDFSLTLQFKIRQMWHNDRDMAEFASASSKTMDNESQTSLENIEKELYWLPLSTKKEIQHAKSEYLKLEYGVHKFNRDVIEKRLYNLIIEPPIPVTKEPEFVVKCREKIVQIRSLYPWLNAKIDSLPADIMKSFRDRLALEAKERREKIVHVPSRRRHELTSFAGANRPIVLFGDRQTSRKRKPTSDDVLSDDEDRSAPARNELEIEFAELNESKLNLEELPLTIATPAKRQRLMPFVLNTPRSTAVSPISRGGDETPTGQQRRAFTFNTDPGRQRMSIVEHLIEESSMDIGAKSSREANRRRVLDGESPVAANTKDWGRINRVVQTPISLKKRVGESSSLSRVPIRLQHQQSQARRSVITQIIEQQSTTTTTQKTSARKTRNSRKAALSVSKKTTTTQSNVAINENLMSPVRSASQAQPRTPASILKTDKRIKDSAAKRRLRFQNVPTMEAIPSRAAMEDARDNSFTTFGNLTETESSSSIAASGLDPEDEENDN